VIFWLKRQPAPDSVAPAAEDGIGHLCFKVVFPFSVLTRAVLVLPPLEPRASAGPLVKTFVGAVTKALPPYGDILFGFLHWYGQAPRPSFLASYCSTQFFLTDVPIDDHP